jgi:hypothetical protein
LLTVLLFVDGLVQLVLSATAVTLASNFVLSLLMVLKRLHVLLRTKFGD